MIYLYLSRMASPLFSKTHMLLPISTSKLKKFSQMLTQNPKTIPTLNSKPGAAISSKTVELFICSHLVLRLNLNIKITNIYVLVLE